jgi:para-nitrobenzyl esterase
MSEDCLSLNIWVPTAAESQMAMPVLVHVHGGAFFIGGGSNRVYNATPFTSKGIIFVTLNYRLGVLGFYRHPDLTSAQPNAPTNFGLLDQALAFKWIRGNIREFGGMHNCFDCLQRSSC